MANDVHLSLHFKLSEFYDPDKYSDVLKGKAAPTVTVLDIDERIVQLMEALRSKFVEKFSASGIVITPHGGFRPDPLNQLVGGASGSQHRLGNAADFRVKLSSGEFLDAPTIAVYTERFMADLKIKGGVGMYHATDNYIHVDARGSNVHWYDSYRSAGCPGQGGVSCIYRNDSAHYKGAGVVLIQKRLAIEADGKFGANTANALKAWQAANGLPADGVFGVLTNRAMGGVLPW